MTFFYSRYDSCSFRVSKVDKITAVCSLHGSSFERSAFRNFRSIFSLTTPKYSFSFWMEKEVVMNAIRIFAVRAITQSLSTFATSFLCETPAILHLARPINWQNTLAFSHILSENSSRYLQSRVGERNEWTKSAVPSVVVTQIVLKVPS